MARKTKWAAARASCVLATALMALAPPAGAEAAIETLVLGEYAISLHLHPFLSTQELEILRLIATDPQYLTLFVPQAQGFSALAASPDEGFVKDGVPVASAIALGGLPDAATAAANTIAACQKAAGSKTPCVVVLEVAPK